MEMIYHIFFSSVEWGPPEDDGGTPVTHYLLEKLEGSKTEWVSCGKTNGDCLKCHVTGLAVGKEYRIQVMQMYSERSFVLHEF